MSRISNTKNTMLTHFGKAFMPLHPALHMRRARHSDREGDGDDYRGNSKRGAFQERSRRKLARQDRLQELSEKPHRTRSTQHKIRQIESGQDEVDAAEKFDAIRRERNENKILTGPEKDAWLARRDAAEDARRRRRRRRKPVTVSPPRAAVASAAAEDDDEDDDEYDDEYDDKDDGDLKSPHDDDPIKEFIASWVGHE